MAHLNPLERLRVLYRDAMGCEPASDHAIISWASDPEIWAQHQIAHRGWSYLACEAVVRACRVHRAAAANLITTQP